MDCATRPTGALGVLDALVPADHVCWAVDDGDDYDAIAASWLAEGAETGDKVVYFGPEASLGGAPSHGAAFDPRVAFLGGGPLDPAAMLGMFRREAAKAEAEGFRALRVLADMDWVAGLSTDDELTAFELRLDATVNELGAIVVCAYRSGTYAPEHVAALSSVHPLHCGTSAHHLGFRVWNNGRAHWHLDGEVDCFGADALGVALRSAATDGPMRLCLDGLRFADVAAMRAIATAARSADVRIRLERPSDTFVRCWSLLGYDTSASSVELAP